MVKVRTTVVYVVIGLWQLPVSNTIPPTTEASQMHGTVRFHNVAFPGVSKPHVIAWEVRG